MGVHRDAGPEAEGANPGGILEHFMFEGGVNPIIMGKILLCVPIRFDS